VTKKRARVTAISRNAHVKTACRGTQMSSGCIMAAN
jgi:hypothetical protein